MADVFSSFDSQVRAQASIDAEKSPTQQRYTNPTTPNPSQLVSNHSAEGLWLPDARDIPQDPPMPPLWTADHSGPTIPYDAASKQSYDNSTIGPQPRWNHDGHEGTNDPANWGQRGDSQPNAYGLLNIGRPFELIRHKIRHLRTDRWDANGRIINPPDAPSAPIQRWNSEHDTRPRWIGFDVAPLFENIGKGPQFSSNPGYLGVSDNQPNLTPRQWGAVAAQMPSDPYVAQSQPVSSEPINYNWLGY